MFTRPWIEPTEITVPEPLAAAVGGGPLVAETLARRGLTDPAAAAAFLDPDRYTPAPAAELPDMGRAVTRLGRAIRGQEPICVWGDFDVDGQTATALLVNTLADLGATVTYHVPRRDTEGHGINSIWLDKVIKDGARLILTCDTGIADIGTPTIARQSGVDMIITDHHDPHQTLPKAVAVINPKLLAACNVNHPLADLPGVGVAYKLAEALYAWARRPGEAEKHLDLVALGIVADLALQRRDTRTLLQRGLARLRRGERPGLAAMLEAADLAPEHLSEEHIGFVLGPRLNAAGRLADAGLCVELLTTSDRTRCRIIAADLEALNARRKLLCDQVEAGARAQIVGERSLLDAPALVLASPHWPTGVIGIVASRLVETYGKPTILIATPPKGFSHASARSVAGINITAAIAANAKLLLGFGGHPMAAGFTIEKERIAEFRRAINRTIGELAAGRSEPEALRIDADLPLSQLSLALVDDLARLAPFGPGNPPLVLAARRVHLVSSRTVGRDEAHRLVRVADEQGAERQVIWWNGGSEEPPVGAIDLAYVARASTYRGVREVQVEWVASRPVWDTGAVVAGAGLAPAPAAITVADYRQARAPRQILDDLVSRGDAAQGEVAVWREAGAATNLPGYDRRSLPRAGTLVIWTIPPGPAELRAALARVRPERVCLFAQDPGVDLASDFIGRLTGLVKHALTAKDGRVDLEALAAATAQRRIVVEIGLAWLEVQGVIHVIERAGDEIHLGGSRLTMQPPQPPRSFEEKEKATLRLQTAAAETAAYRAFYRSADAAAIVPV